MSHYYQSRGKTFRQNTHNIVLDKTNNIPGKYTIYPRSEKHVCGTFLPNNQQFASQGAVSSSSIILRKKMNILQKNGNTSFNNNFSEGRENEIYQNATCGSRNTRYNKKTCLLK
jgi:hypothetical protein